MYELPLHWRLILVVLVDAFENLHPERGMGVVVGEMPILCIYVRVGCWRFGRFGRVVTSRM